MSTPDRTPVTRPEASYLITGGTGGIGRSVTRWLALQGAKNIILASRSGMSQIGTRELVEELQAMGVEVLVYSCDIREEKQVSKMVSYVQETMPPICGVIHGAMVVQVSVIFTTPTLLSTY